MPLAIATHNGAFHADDVLACALLQVFVDPAATVTRTRDPELLAQADVVVDVGGTFDPGRLRFDHHQKSYQGDRSSAGMVLDWLQAEGHVGDELATLLRDRIVTYVDAVDNGRVEPDPAVPCFPNIVSACNRGAQTLSDFDGHFQRAVEVGRAMVEGLVAEQEELDAAAAVVHAAMAEADAHGRNYLRLDEYVRWKPAYYAAGGATHTTVFVLMPGLDGSWRAVAIPPHEGSFDQKQSLPEAWAGLVDDELAEVAGVPGAKFCHKNRFICVWDTEAHLLEALRRSGMITG